MRGTENQNAVGNLSASMATCVDPERRGRSADARIREPRNSHKGGMSQGLGRRLRDVDAAP
jgi:hypothetical protein